MIANKFNFKNIDYYRYNCDKTIKIKSKNNHFKFLRHRECEKLLQISHTIQISNFSDVDKIYDDFNTNHNKQFQL